MDQSRQLENLLTEFAIPGNLQSLEPLHVGHIHDSYVSTWRDGATETRYLHQRVNENVFRDVAGLMENISRVTQHIRAKLLEQPAGSRETTLELIPAGDGRAGLRDRAGRFWRTFLFIPDVRSFNRCETASQAGQAAAAFGRFNAHLVDLDPRLLHETIENFLDLPHRYRQLDEAIRRNPVGRLGDVEPEVEFALLRRNQAGLLSDAIRSGDLPLRVAHGDPKLNNILFDSHSGEVVCVVDLDTCMPGTLLYDFGDLFRNTAVPTREDEPDLSKIALDSGYARAIVESYLKKTRHFLSPGEIDLMPRSPQIMGLLLGTRFLTDYIAGDVYFKIDVPRHNLRRARAQFKIVESLERNEGALIEMVRESSG